MKTKIDINERSPIWMALSEFYLDTELEDADLRNIAFIILESPYSLEQVKEINKYEVFPVLQSNLNSVAGDWMGFDEKWLIDEISKSLSKRNKLSELGIEFSYFTSKWMQAEYWKRLESIYVGNMEEESFIMVCREAYLNGVKPFQASVVNVEFIERLKKIAIKHKNQDRLQSFYFNLNEYQYCVNLWAAYFLLEHFELSNTDMLIGLDDSKSVIDDCIETVERYLPDLETIEESELCRAWLEEKKNSRQQGV